MRIASFLLFLVLPLAAMAQVPAAGQPEDRLLFTVKGEPYRSGEFVFLYKKNHQDKTDYTPDKINAYFDLFVNFKLKVTDARMRGMDTTAAFRNEFKSYKDELRKPYLAEKDEVERLSEETYQRLKEEIKVAHILLMVKPDASGEDTLKVYNRVMEIRGRVLAGEDFGKLARTLSEDPSAKNNSGELGYFTALQMVYPFESAAYRLHPGELSMPVRTRFGYHLIRMEGRQPARGEVEVSHIILRSGTTDEAKLKNKIFEIFDQLQAGRSWDELCKEYSDDPATRNSGGRLRPFGVGAMSGVPEFERVAFSLRQPGEISDPFQTAYGWHIIRLEKRIPLPPYSEMQAALRKKIARDERLPWMQKQTLEAKKKEFDYVPSSAVQQILALADSSLQRGKWKIPTDFNGTQTLFSLRGTPYAAAPFMQFAARNQKASALSPSAQMNELIDRYVGEEIEKIQEKKLLAENPEFRNMLTEYREGILLFSIMEIEVWNKATQDTAGLKSYYQKHLSRYQAGERVRARIFSITDAGFLASIREKISKGDSITKKDMKSFKSVSAWRNYGKSESKVIDQCPWAVGVHVYSSEGIHYLVEVEKLLPPGQKSFEDARAQVTSDYQDELERNWVASLKQKYPVKINNKNRKIVVTELTKS